MQCPKCGYKSTAREDAISPEQCPSCGIYYAKFFAQQAQAKNLEDAQPKHQAFQVQKKASTTSSGEVVIVDVKMPFWSMVVFMVKWAFAAIPAMIVIGVVVALLTGFLGFFISLGSSSTSKPVTYETNQSSKTPSLPLSNKKESATAIEVNELITAKLLSKGFDDEGYRSEITLKLLFENKTGRNIQAFEGILRLEDLLGNNVKNVRITINDATWNGTELAWEGAMRFNKFKDDDQKFRSISEDSLKAQFDVVKILYQDGEMLEI